MNIIEVTDNEVGVVFTEKEWKTYLYIMKFVGSTTPQRRREAAQADGHDPKVVKQLEYINITYADSGWDSMKDALQAAGMYPKHLKDCLK